jgi:uncharacterized protein (DUF934 family)
MPMFISLRDDRLSLEEDPFTNVPEDQEPPHGDIIVSLARFQADGDRLISEGRLVGVRLGSDEAVEDLAYDLPRVAVLALVFPKFSDGRAYSNASLARERYGFKGQLRAVGDVLREQVGFMARCGFDAFVPSDGSTVEDLERALHRYRHVYQRAIDRRAPAFAERGE